MYSASTLADRADVSRLVRIRCLGSLLVADGNARREQELRCLPKARELLLRVIASGLQGASAGQLAPILWPETDLRRRRRMLLATMQSLDAAIGSSGALALQGDQLAVNEAAIRVDSLVLERTLAPVLNPFHPPSAGDCAASRQCLRETGSAEFLEGMGDAWVLAARMRIADARCRAVAILLKLPSQPVAERDAGQHLPATNGETP